MMNAAEARERALRAIKVNQNIACSKAFCDIDSAIEEAVKNGKMRTKYVWGMSMDIFSGKNIVEEYCQKLKTYYEQMGYTVFVDKDKYDYDNPIITYIVFEIMW